MTMGLFWDLIQQSQISDQGQRSDSLENQVYCLQQELQQTRTVLHKLIMIMEEKFGEDIDGDGKLG